MSRAAITQAGLSFEGKTYASGAFGSFLNAFGVTELLLEAEPLIPDEDGSKNFTLKGAGSLLSQPISVDIYFDFTADDAFEFQLQTRLPVLTLTKLNQLGILPSGRFVQPVLAVPITYTDAEVVFDSEGLRLACASPESTTHIDLFPKLTLERIGFGLLKSYAQRSTQLDLYATLQIGTTPIEVKVAVPLGGSLTSVAWVLTSRNAIPLNAGLKDLATLLLDTFGVSATQVFPDALAAIPTFIIRDLQLVLDPIAQPSLRYLSFRIHTVHDLALGGGVAVRDVGMRVAVTPDASGPHVSLTLFGEIRVKDDVVLDLQVMLPPDLASDPWTLFMSGGVELGGLDVLGQLPVGHGPSDLQLHPGFFKLTSFDLKGFEVSFNPVSKSIRSVVFDLVVRADCELFHGFALKDPRLSFMAQNPLSEPDLPPKSLTGTILGTIAVGDVNFGISAAKRADGWDFTGETAPGAIPIGKMVSAFVDHYGIRVPRVVEAHLTLDSLGMGFSTTAGQAVEASTSVKFHAAGTFPLGSAPDSKLAHLTFETRVEDRPGTKQYQRSFGGTLQVGSVGFGMRYDEDPNTSACVGVYSSPPGEGLSWVELLRGVAPSLGALVPDGLSVTVQDALFGFSRSGRDARKFVFGVDLAVTFDFARLPLVGKFFSASQGALGFDHLQVLYASQAFELVELQALNGLLAAMQPPLPRRLPEPPTQGKGAGEGAPPALREGLNVAAVLNMGGAARPLTFPTAIPPSAPQTPDAQPSPYATSTDSAFWLDIQRAIGPVQIQRVGVEYRDGLVWLLFSASLSAAGLTIVLDGLALGAPLRDFALDKLRASLRGLGIDYHDEAVEIGGSFLAVQPDSPGDPVEYCGSAVLKARGLTLSALGAYSTLDEQSSFFLYALLDYPIGGPAFFFVTGLAAGFGYNRALSIPTVEQVGRFPLVQAALSPDVDRSSGLADLARAVPPALGEHFLAAGIAFSSFKLVQSFVLLSVAFGKRLELHLVGLSKLRLPAQDESEVVSPLAEVELSLKGSYVPTDGFLELRALLTPTSYLFKRDCHLSGGFAFMCWFTPESRATNSAAAKPDANAPPAGDFVLTLGGYHPQFHVPEHYPTVPRLAFTWQVVPELSLKGDLYFALTPAAVMAGGHLDAEWRSGSVLAWFKAGIDFIIAWKPYHYDVSAYVDLGVEVTFELFGTHRLTLEVGADLHLWGPDLSGEATVHLWIISFTIHFGKDAAQKPTALGWSEVERSFFTSAPQKGAPALPQVCSIALAAGLVGSAPSGPSDLGVVDGKHLRIVTQSRIPSTKAFYKTARASSPTEIPLAHAPPSFGIAPMGLAAVDSSVHTIEIARIVNKKPEPAGHLFTYEPVFQNVPGALFGSSLEAHLNGPAFVEQALVGFDVSPGAPAKPDTTQALDRDQLLIDARGKERRSRWEHDVPAFEAENLDADARRTRLTQALASAAAEHRNALLEGLGMDTTQLGLDAALTYDFVAAPELELSRTKAA